MSLQSVIFLMGATASGKTELAMRLCDRLPCDIINVDSAQIYRHLNVGAAKPDSETLAKYPHRLLDIRDPADVYSVAEFRTDAIAEIEKIVAAGRIPVLVGGTMMYFKALLDDLADMPEANNDIRADIAARAEQLGWPVLHEELAKVDPDMAAKIHPNHSHRISRALEVFLASGKTMSDYRREQQSKQSLSLLDQYNIVQCSLALKDRKMVHAKISERFDVMLEQGLVDEVASLRARGDLNKDLPAIRSVGYRQVWDFLDGAIDYPTMVEMGKAATRQLAKRQLTWLRNWPYETIDIDAELSLEKKIELISDKL